RAGSTVFRGILSSWPARLLFQAVQEDFGGECPHPQGGRGPLVCDRSGRRPRRERTRGPRPPLPLPLLPPCSPPRGTAASPPPCPSASGYLEAFPQEVSPGGDQRLGLLGDRTAGLRRGPSKLSSMLSYRHEAARAEGDPTEVPLNPSSPPPPCLARP